MPMVDIRDVRKRYDGGFEALKGVSLAIEEGEILALLGPNGAGKTTLISAICGITRITDGTITVGGHDVIDDFRAARSLIGLVPQDIHIEPFQVVADAVRFSRGLFGLRPDEALVERILRRLSLWDKRDAGLMELSGGMKRRVMIAKALVHEPRVLFLDEPTAGVDVELRRDMWDTVRDLQRDGVTIILTTHYIEEAEAMADRVGVINKGEILLVEDKASLMSRMGQKELTIELIEPIAQLPDTLSGYDLRLSQDGTGIIYSYDTRSERTGIGRLMGLLAQSGCNVRDLHTAQNSLEDIFVGLVGEGKQEDAP